MLLQGTTENELEDHLFPFSFRWMNWTNFSLSIPSRTITFRPLDLDNHQHPSFAQTRRDNKTFEWEPGTGVNVEKIGNLRPQM